MNFTPIQQLNAIKHALGQLAACNLTDIQQLAAMEACTHWGPLAAGRAQAMSVLREHLADHLPARRCLQAMEVFEAASFKPRKEAPT